MRVSRHTGWLLSLFLILALLLGACTACAASPVVMTYNGVPLGENVYRYWLSCYRAQFAYEDDGTNTDRLAARATENIKKTLVCVSLFDSYGLVLDDTARTQINAAMDKLMAEAGGTRADLDRVAAKYGTDYDGLKTAISYEQKAAGLYNYLFGEGNHFSLDDKKYEDYMAQTYARVRMIYIPYTMFTIDSDGMKIPDPVTGAFLTEPKGQAAREEAVAHVAAVRAALADGTDDAEFSALVAQYTEDPAATGYPNGYYFSSEVDYTDYLPEVTARALSLAGGEVGTVGNETDGYTFLYRLPPAGGDWKEEANADFFDGFVRRVKTYWFETLISTYVSHVEVDEAVAAGIVYADIPENWELYW